MNPPEAPPARPATARLPDAEKTRLLLGFMRLTDAAPLVIARERGFFEDFGLDVDLVREVSWANIRDKVTVGALDAAQMLAPMPLVTALGMGGLRCRLLTGLMLNLNGNAITLATRLHDRLGDGDGHLQSLVLGGVLLMMGFISFLAGLVADLISFNRQLQEMALERIRRMELSGKVPGQKGSD